MFEKLKSFFLKRRPVKSEEELQEIIAEGEARGIITAEEEEMMSSVLKLDEKDVEQVMVPRTDMVCVSADQTIEETIQTIIDQGYSRLPVYHERIENIIGIVYAKDLFKFREHTELPVIEALRLPHFILANKKVTDAIKDLQKNRLSLAVTVDEHGEVAGLVSVEDLIEEIVGEFEDEFDKREILYKPLSDKFWLINARIELDEFNKRFGTHYQDEDVNTLAGLICKRLDRIPQEGEDFEIDSLKMKIVGASKQRIYKVLLKKE